MEDMQEKDPIRAYMYIQRELKKARANLLNEIGISEEGLKELHDQALAVMDSDPIKNEYGTLQKIVDKPVTWTVQRTANVVKLWKYKLIFTTTKEK